MKKLLLTAACIACGTTGAWAQTACTDDGTTMICDPTAFHVSAPGATGQDPVLLNNSHTFTITEVGNKDITSPMRVLIIEPGSNTDDITSITGQMASLVTMADPLGKFSFGATSIAALGSFSTVTDSFSGPAVTMQSGQDLIKQIGFSGGAASISFKNITDEYTALGLAIPTTFDVFDAIVPVNFTSDADFLTVNGDFNKGTVISAIGLNISIGNHGKVNIDVFDNSWTTAGFVNTTIGPPVPEPSTWAMFIAGFGLLGLVGYRQQRRTSRVSA